MKTIPVEMIVIDATGDERSETVRVGLMPPAEDACQVCGHRPAHGEDEPHDALSLYYQYAFYGERGRWPTWADAVAHCSEEVRAKWEEALRERGLWSDD